MTKCKLKRTRTGKRLLNERQRKFLEGVAAGQNHAQAYLDAGYNTRYAKQAAYLALTKKGMRQALQQAMEAKGYTVSGLVNRVIVPGMRAMSVERTPFEGSFTDERRDVDHTTRGQFLDRYTRLMGWSNASSDDGDSGGRPPVTLNLVVTDPEVAADIARCLAAAATRDPGQPRLDAGVDTDEGRAGSDPAV